MKVFEKNSVENSARKLKIASIGFSMILTLGAATFAQSIDDVLKPKQSTSKPATKTPAKTVKKKNGSGVKPKSTKIKSPGNTPTVAYSSESSDQILNRFMNFQQSAGVTNRDWNSVIAQTAKVLKDNPNHATAKAQSLIAQGQIAYNERNYSMAIFHFKAALQIMPQSSLVHYSLGKAYLANGQAEAAERSLKESIDQNEKFALAYKSLGDAFAAQGERKTAAKYFKKATEISVKDGNMNP